MELRKGLSRAIEETGAGKDGFWEALEVIMKHLTNYSPEELYPAAQEAKRVRDSANNKYSAGEAGMRQVACMPSVIDRVASKLAKEKDYNPTPEMFHKEFARRYPQFSAAEKI